MKFKKPVEMLQWDIHARAMSAANSALQNGFGYNNQAMQPLVNAIAQAIAQATAESFRVMMEQQYTDEDFERDIGLKDSGQPR